MNEGKKESKKEGRKERKKERKKRRGCKVWSPYSGVANDSSPLAA